MTSELTEGTHTAASDDAQFADSVQATAPVGSPVAAPAVASTPSKKAEDLLVRLLAAHKSFYDISRDYLFSGRIFPGYAEYHAQGQQYVLVKRAKLWEVSTHEFLFFDIAKYLDEENLAQDIAFMTEKAIRKVHAGPNHMSSALSLVIIAEKASDEALRMVRKTRFRKNFAFAFHGWCDFRLAVVDLSRDTREGIVTNPVGKALRDVLERNIALVNNDGERIHHS